MGVGKYSEFVVEFGVRRPDNAKPSAMDHVRMLALYYPGVPISSKETVKTSSFGRMLVQLQIADCRLSLALANLIDTHATTTMNTQQLFSGRQHRANLRRGRSSAYDVYIDDASAHWPPADALLKPLAPTTSRLSCGM